MSQSKPKSNVLSYAEIKEKPNVTGLPLMPETPEVDLIWTFNNVSVEFDMTDVDTRAHFYACLDRMNERQKNAPKAGSTDDIVRGLCAMMRDFLDDLFGEGMGAKFIDRTSQAKAQNCFASLNNFVRNQLATAMGAGMEIIGSVRDNPNRAQRRAASKATGKQ